MADEIRNPMDVAAGQRTPMEYLQQLFSKPLGPPPASTFEESATSTFPPGEVVGAGTPTIKPDISSLTGFENTGEPEIRPGPSLPMTAALIPNAALIAKSAQTQTAPLPPSPDQENIEMLKKLGASGLLPADFWAKHPDIAGGVMKVHGPPDRWSMARKLEGLGETVPEINRDEMIKALKQAGSIQANIESQTTDRIKDMMNEFGLSYFKMTDPQILARLKLYPGAGPSGTADLTNKLYTLLEPNRKTKIEQTMFDVINQVGDVLKKSLTGPSSISVAENIFAHGPAWKTAGLAEQKLPAEIKNLESQAAAHTATALEGPAKIKHLEAMANYYNIRPTEHGANIGSMATSILTHDMTEAAKIDMDPILNPVQKKEAHAAREERTKNALNAVTTLMNKPTPGALMTASQFRRQAQASGYMPDQIQRELAILIQQGKVING